MVNNKVAILVAPDEPVAHTASQPSLTKSQIDLLFQKGSQELFLNICREVHISTPNLRGKKKKNANRFV